MLRKNIPYWANKDMASIVDNIDGVLYTERWRFIKGCENEYMVRLHAEGLVFNYKQL